MTSLSALINAYIDVNLLLAFACPALAGRGANPQGHRPWPQPSPPSLRALRHDLPRDRALALPGCHRSDCADAKQAGLTLARRVNLTDFVVAQYLQGRFQMEPAEFQSLLGARRQFATGSVGNVGLGLILASAFAVGLRWSSPPALIASMLKLRRAIDDSFIWRRFGQA